MVEDKLTVLYDYVTISVNSLPGFDATQGASIKILSTNENGFRITKCEWSVQHNADARSQPIVVGICGPGLTATELEETLEQVVTSGFDKNRQITNRRYWILTTLEASTFGGKLCDNGVTNINWSWPEGTNLIYFLYNPTGVACNADEEVHIQCKYYGVFLTD